MTRTVPNQFIAMRPRPVKRRPPRIKSKTVAPVTVRYECPVCAGPHARAECAAGVAA